jgi:16S rRNA (cytosine1402-N4)-methyltransferase
MSKQISELHIPVALERAVEVLGESLAKPGAVFVDCTLGLGGHTEAFLQRFPNIHVVAIDRDPQAIALAAERLKPFADRIDFVNTTYDNIDEAIEELGIDKVDAILLDLGVSSMQLDERERGFAYSYEAPLDMRMNSTKGKTAAEVVNGYSEDNLAKIFFEYGEERYSKAIAKAVVAARAEKPFETSTELAALIAKVVPFIPGKSSGHPAKRVFQALRIEVNEELEVLKATMPRAIHALAIDGRILVMSYHSLEDRIVKQALVAAATSSAPLDLPIELPEHAPQLRLITKGAETATDSEIEINPRSASVKIRAAQKIRQAA